MSTKLSAATLALLALAGPLGAQPLPATNFAATHNSYSGNISGQRGTIQQQLDAGARFIEYDINLGNYTSNHDYQIGHGSPGNQVDHTSPNPSTNNLAAWLQLLAAWSDQNPGHAPITLGLDSKDNLSGQDSPAQGNPSALNAELAQYLGSRLFTAAELGGAAWPDWQTLKGRILVVLSGNQTNRQQYRSDQGKTPAVAINAAGQAIVAYQSTQTATLWYWYGNAGANGAIGWPAHGKYDSGVTPAVAIDGGGVIVEVHQSQSTSKLYSHVGVFRDGQVQWGASQPLNASGSLPSVAFTGANTVSEIHQGANGNEALTGTVNPQSLTIQWSAASATSQPRHPTTTSTAGAYSVTVQTGSNPTAGTLLYSTPQAQGRVVYPQVMFTEFQKGDSSQLGNDGLSFYACSDSSSNWSWAGQQRQSGKIVRIWSFDEDDTAIPVPPNFPATDTPYASWYTQYCSRLACQQ
jgi:hypothetical protein